jgi:hypothetical protein
VKSSTRPDAWLPPKSAFAGFRFPLEVIVVAVRWYLRFNLSYRDVEELLVERGVEVDHVTVFRLSGCGIRIDFSEVASAQTPITLLCRLRRVVRQRLRDLPPRKAVLASNGEETCL